MQLLITETRFHGCFYDRLFQVHKSHVTPIDRLFDEHVFPDPKLEGTYDLPRELVHKIVMHAIVSLLKERNFECAMQLIGFDVATIHRVYAGIFGSCSSNWRQKLHRLSRIVHIAANLYDEYFLAEAYMDTPAVLLDYEQEFMISNHTSFYPWNMSPLVSLIQIDHLEIVRTRKIFLGPKFGDRALLVHPRERKGVMLGDHFAFPFIHFIFMDAFTILSVFKNPETKYYFTRFAMFLKAIFGPYSQVYFYKQKVENEEEDHIFQSRYLFEELPNCMRK